MRILALFVFALVAAPANAACTNYASIRIGASAADKLYGEMDRLICLHNEQSAQIQAQDQRIAELENSVRDLSKLVLQHEIELGKR